MLSRLALRTRLTLWYSLVLLATLGAFGALVYGVVSYQLHHHHDPSLRRAATAVERVLKQHADCEHLTPAQVGELDQIGHLILLHDVGGEGRLFYRSPDTMGVEPPFDLRVETEVLQRASWFETLPTATGPVRVLSAPYRSHAGRNGLIRVMDPLGDVDEPLEGLRHALLLALPLALLIAAVGGHWLAGRALAPVDAVTRLAREIKATQLDRRLPEPAVRDELGRLVDTLNEMISRLESSFDGMRRFTADASHELRGPLGTMRGVVDVALRRPRGAEEYRAALVSVGEEVDRLRSIVDSLLVLARADAGRLPLDRAAVRLDVLASEAAESVRGEAAERGVIIEVVPGPPVTAIGDEVWLRRILQNLLDNAVKFSAAEGAPGARVTLAASLREGACVVEVSDSGPGIPEDVLPRIFERFFRADPARGRAGASGFGLGLSICATVAEAHGGTLRAANRPSGGCTLTLTLPR